MRKYSTFALSLFLSVIWVLDTGYKIQCEGIYAHQHTTKEKQALLKEKLGKQSYLQ